MLSTLTLRAKLALPKGLPRDVRRKATPLVAELVALGDQAKKRSREVERLTAETTRLLERETAGESIDAEIVERLNGQIERYGTELAYMLTRADQIAEQLDRLAGVHMPHLVQKGADHG